MTLASTNTTLASRSLPINQASSPIPFGKRILDIVVSTLMIIVLLPLMIITGLAIKLNSKGPVFFVQTRVGLNGKTFGMVKFRSMYRDAEARRAELLAQSDRTGVCFKKKNDPRITNVGRIIRRYSIDELPQLFNVLKGDMSLVGPRPALPSEVASYPIHALDRLKILPGITGIWQVSGRAEVSFDEMVEMDISYARSMGLRRDLHVLFLTIPAVLLGRGAY